MHRLLAAGLATSLFGLFACAVPGDEVDPNRHPLSSQDDVTGGAPANSTLPDDNKADAVYPEKQFLSEQSPVRDQGWRGVCSIFASTALVENLYIKAGMANPDFSEQYMQWAVKNLTKSFPNTEGSDAGANLQTVVKYGTINETDWKYDDHPWTAANDPACTGTSQPTKCYTNGEPPATVAAATKFKLPSSRWLNINSIKAHITSEKTGVVVGMTFFFQAWNHRASKLPIDADLWAKGVVTYPNDKDKEVSLAEHEGHAILIVGWDDNAEFPSRDADGKPTGEKEKGFYIFKNSWATDDFGVDNPNGAGYGYLSYKYVAEYGSAVVAGVPTLTGGDPPPTGGTKKDYMAAVGDAIPDNDPAGVASTIHVTDTGAIKSATVTVDITHTYRGDLVVKLAHGTDSVQLIANDGGSAHDLKQTFNLPTLAGKPLAGDWTLTVVDTAAQDTGTFNSWSLDAAIN